MLLRNIPPFISALLLVGGATVSGQRLQAVFTTDQNSNTLSVVDATNQTLLGQIRLGYPAEDKRLFHPLYNGEINVHGISYDPVQQHIAAVSTVSNSVTLLDASSGKILRKAYIGRNPHEPRFTPNGTELWVTVRGESHIVVLDAITLKEKGKIQLSEGPGMVAFSKTGDLAFVSSSFNGDFWIIDTQTKQIVTTLKVPSTFSPFVNITPDGQEAWVTHKDVGMVTRVDVKSRSIVESIQTGPITNHVGFIGDKICVTVGGENKVKVYQLLPNRRIKLVTEVATNSLPHGIWGNESTAEVYVVAELANTMHILDAATWKVKATIPIGERPQALVVAQLPITGAALAQSLSQQHPVFKGPKQ